MTDRALQLLRRDARLAELAAFPFNFDLDRADHVEEVRLASGGPLEPIAGDDTGGTYFVCADGSVLYAGSEGSAGIIGDSVDEALEVLIGLPTWHDLLGLAPSDGEEKILAAVTETEDDLRECYRFDTERTELRAALALPERRPVELVRMLYAALMRTEPDFVLLNAEEGCAHRLLDRHPRPPLDEPLFTWTARAREQGRREPARVALIRLLDEISFRAYCDAQDGKAPDTRGTPQLLSLVSEFEALGDTFQALRARSLYVRVPPAPPAG